MNKTFPKINLLLVAILTLSLFSSTLVYADNASTHDGAYDTNNSNDLMVYYTIENNIILEHASFTDSDGSYVNILRTIVPDGSGILTTTKNGSVQHTQLCNQDYEIFLKIATSSRIQSRGSTIGSDVTGSQFKHVYISSNTITFTQTVLTNIISNGISYSVEKFLEKSNSPYAIAYQVVSTLYSILPSVDAYKTVITDTVYEVLFSYDNVYYTHCYHETMKSYNQSGSLIDTTRIYKQAIGG